MKIVDYLIQAIKEKKITKEKALQQLKNVRDNLKDFEGKKKELIRRFNFLSN